MKNYRVKIRKRRKRMFVDRMGGKCQIPECGYDKCLDSLEFHHVDSDEKEYTPSELMNYSIKKIEKELKKCILVCSNCHSEIHAEEYDFEYDEKYLENLKQEWYETICEFCNTTFLTMIENQKFCDVKCSSLSQRKVKVRPTKNELKKLISEHTWKDLGRMFSVSDNAVRKWARKYKLI